MQKRGIPTVAVVTEKFVSLAKASARALGYPDLPMVVVPHPFETLSAAAIREIADEKVHELVAKGCLRAIAAPR
jgi:hypothetical protein